MKPAAWVMAAVAGAIGAAGAHATGDGPPGAETSVDTVAAIQFAPEPGHAAGNMKRLAALVEDAAGRGARIVVLPELAVTGPLTGAGAAASRAAEPIPGPATEFFGALAKRLGIWIGLSLAERAEGGGFFITALILDDHGHVMDRFRKVMVRGDGSDGGARRGDFRDILESVDAVGLRIGIIAGDDLHAGVPRLANRGTDTILIPARWSARDAVPWREVAERLAKDYEVNLVVANRRHPDDPGTGEMSGVFSWLGGFMQARPPNGDTAHLAPLGRRRTAWRPATSLGLPSIVPVPLHDGGSAEIADLGRQLFFDPALSSTGEVACASCHLPERAFTNGERKGIGVHGRTTKRNVPTLLNVAFRPLLQWDGYASSLENFAKYPISNVDEMNSHYLDDVPALIRSRDAYVRAFERTMRVKSVEFEHVARALAAYMRTLISGSSPFDRFRYGGDASALPPDARAGFRLFEGKARCSQCHLVGERSALFMDLEYHVTGVGYDRTTGVFVDIGLGSISTDDQTGLFQTPTLRNVAETAPYMHDGSIATLEEVVDYYDRGGNPAPRLDPLMKPLRLTAAEKRTLVAFLESLTGAERYAADGTRVPQTRLGGTR